MGREAKKARFRFQISRAKPCALATSVLGPSTRNSSGMSLQVEPAPPSRRTCFTNSTMITLEGIARAPVDEYEPCRCMHIGLVFCLRPAEECLLSGFPCTLLRLAIRQGSATLCAHSLGITVAVTVAARLTTCGLCVHGTVGLDPRCGQTQDLWGSPSGQPRCRFAPSLTQSSAPNHFRLAMLSVVDYVAPQAPRGQLSGRYPNVADVAPWHHCQAAWRQRWWLTDTDHYAVRRSHTWDISCCIANA